MQKDAWSQILDFLQSLIVPNWSDLIALLPLLIVIGVLGPALSLLVLYHLYHRVTRKQGRVKLADPEAYPAPLDEFGDPVFPPNVPFCSAHGLLFPGRATRCHLDGSELSVRCPVDDVTRLTSQQTCRACGTRYVLGASRSALVVRRAGRPPEGGAAIA